MEVSKQDPDGACKGARPQIKEVRKLTDVSSERHAMALVLKLRKRANMSPKGLARGLVVKLWIQANK